MASRKPFRSVLAALALLAIVIATRPWAPPTSDDAAPSPAPDAAVSAGDAEDASVAFELTEVAPDVFRSPAGLVYRPGLPGEHRIDHVLTHCEDRPDKPIHGVFDGGRDFVLPLLDEAWRAVSRGNGGTNAVRTERQGDRTVHTVRLDRRIGWVGGAAGARDDHPACRFVRLVLENGNDVITAYPTRSF